MATPLNILIVEDSADDTELLLAELRRAGFNPTWKRIETEADFLAGIKNPPDIILSDYSMPAFSGLRAAELLHASGLDIPFILVSGTVGEEVAVEAMRHGATDYLLKDRIVRLGSAVKRALREAQANRERTQTEAALRRNEARFRSLTDILQYRTGTTQSFLDFALEEAIKLTGSKLGYIYFYHEDRKQFVLNTWSKDVMKECAVADPQTCYELDKTGIWGEAVRQRQPIVLNDFQATHQLKKGYPEGHAKLHRFLTIPVLNGDQIVAVAAVANKESDYQAEDVVQLQLLMGAVWKVVEQRNAVAALQQSEEKYRNLFEGSREAIMTLEPPAWNFTSGNPAAIKMFGARDEADFISHASWDLSPEWQPDGRGSA